MTKHPGQKNNLDALCKRYEIDNSQRDLHGALLDAQILLDVYLTMTGGQETLGFDNSESSGANTTNNKIQLDMNRISLPLIEPTEDELEAHMQRLNAIREQKWQMLMVKKRINL